jgi:hypothetical protein
MIHKGDPQFPNPPRHGAPHAALLNRRALLAGPAAVLCTKAPHAAAAELRSLVLSLAGAVQVTPRNVSVTPVLFNGRDCVEVRLSGDYPGPDRDYFAYVPGLDMSDGTIEVELAGAPLPGAPGGARGFAGLAFRIDEAGGSFACESASTCPAAVLNSCRRGRATGSDCGQPEARRSSPRHCRAIRGQRNRWAFLQSADYSAMIAAH